MTESQTDAQRLGCGLANPEPDSIHTGRGSSDVAATATLVKDYRFPTLMSIRGDEDCTRPRVQVLQNPPCQCRGCGAGVLQPGKMPHASGCSSLLPQPMSHTQHWRPSSQELTPSIVKGGNQYTERLHDRWDVTSSTFFPPSEPQSSLFRKQDNKDVMGIKEFEKVEAKCTPVLWQKRAENLNNYSDPNRGQSDIYKGPP